MLFDVFNEFVVRTTDMQERKFHLVVAYSSNSENVLFVKPFFTATFVQYCILHTRVWKNNTAYQYCLPMTLL